MGTSKYPELNAITLDTQKKNSTWSFICNFFKIKILDLRDILFSLSIKHELNSGSSRCSSIGESVRLKYTEFVRLGVRFAPSTCFFFFERIIVYNFYDNRKNKSSDFIFLHSNWIIELDVMMNLIMKNNSIYT